MDYFSEINDFVEFIPRDTTKVCSILSNTFLNNWSKKQKEHRKILFHSIVPILVLTMGWKEIAMWTPFLIASRYTDMWTQCQET